MTEFLKYVAEKIASSHASFEDVAIVFPNRRASMYFTSHFGGFFPAPVFAPQSFTIEEFVGSMSTRNVVDKLTLIQELHSVYQRIINVEGAHDKDKLQSFSDFYFWGEMLLKDFEELDSYLASASKIFRDLTDQKELDLLFDSLTEEQVQFLTRFWGDFEGKPSLKKEQFLFVWRRLSMVYSEFKKTLVSNNNSYSGLLYREVAEGIEKVSDAHGHLKKIYFVGFNALTKSEEVIISWFVKNKESRIFWDIDQYYFSDRTQEAGSFFREYQSHPVLGNTFPTDVPSNFKLKAEAATPIHVVGAGQPMAQVKALAQMIAESMERGMDPNETLIILPDEQLLVPVLHSLPASIKKINVSMGMSLMNTPLFGLLELIIDLQIKVKENGLSPKAVLAILNHSYVRNLSPERVTVLKDQMIAGNGSEIAFSFAQEEEAIIALLFKVVPTDLLIAHLTTIIDALGKSPTILDMDKEFAFNFHKFFTSLETKLPLARDADEDVSARKKNIKSFQRLMRQLLAAEKIPFSGEPMSGLQIMGVLETRNLDFKNIFILSMNEGMLPAGSSKGSYIPFNIRKCYGLPTNEQQDAMYAYLFYRILQRSENVNIFYSTAMNGGGQGEMSRYLMQLLYESNLNFVRKTAFSPLEPVAKMGISIQKDESTQEALKRIFANGISPSALNTYLECRLKFFLRYISKIKEPAEVDEELDARVFGDILHKVMDLFYKDVVGDTGVGMVKETDFEDLSDRVDAFIDTVFTDHYGAISTDDVIEYRGQRMVVKEVVKKFVLRILYLDKQYAPFEMVGLEKAGLSITLPVTGGEMRLTGVVDRADKKDDILRIVDYKTGKDELNFESIHSLFEPSIKRNKAAFQTLFYAALFVDSEIITEGLKVVPGLINRKNLFEDNFSFGIKMGKTKVENAAPLLVEFKENLQRLGNEMLDREVPFDQISDVNTCLFCEFSKLCGRK